MIRRVTVDPDGTFDELFAIDATVHIEAMSGTEVWVSVRSEGREVVLRLSTDSALVIDMEENTDG